MQAQYISVDFKQSKNLKSGTNSLAYFAVASMIMISSFVALRLKNIFFIDLRQKKLALLKYEKSVIQH